MIEIKDRAKFDQVVSDAIESAITNAKDEQTAKRWENAINRAVDEIENNPYLHFDAAEKHLIVVSSTSNNLYSANGVCQCKAFIEFSQPCWHRACARLVRLYLEAVAPKVCRYCEKETTTGLDHYDCETFAISAAQSVTKAAKLTEFADRINSLPKLADVRTTTLPEILEAGNEKVKSNGGADIPYLKPSSNRKPEKIGNIRI